MAKSFYVTKWDTFFIVILPKLLFNLVELELWLWKAIITMIQDIRITNWMEWMNKWMNGWMNIYRIDINKGLVLIHSHLVALGENKTPSSFPKVSSFFNSDDPLLYSWVVFCVSLPISFFLGEGLNFKESLSQCSLLSSLPPEASSRS